MKFSWQGMNFECDPNKSQANLLKHGRPLSDSYLVWALPFKSLLKAATVDEARFVRRGLIEDQVWLCVYTMRDEAFRVISLRPAHEKERELP